ncbi:MAG TPA: hypothetical protein DCR14_01025 [Acidimicrobiaceae bacterium]|nr:hypothetical protein [Acidimicrobiaceae bacterium]
MHTTTVLPVELTTVADDMAVWHAGQVVVRVEHLDPGTPYDLFGQAFHTLARPAGELLCRVATVNDVHFGEVECGRIDDHPQGPIQRSAPGEPPYPDTMNQAAVAEIAAVDPAAVIVKGDLSADGLPHEWAAFEACYRTAFGPRLHVVRGNHDAYRGQHEYAGDQLIELPGISIALLDTVIPERTTGWLTAEQIDWLDTVGADTDRPVLVMGHHQQWLPGGAHGETHRSDDYFGLHPDPSDALSDVFARRPALLAYTAGHTHRHRVRHMACGAPSIEVGCVKDFPGTWAEYRVYEGGVLQVVHRISSRPALAWSERCRHLYADFGVDYEAYALGTLDDRCCTIPLR